MIAHLFQRSNSHLSIQLRWQEWRLIYGMDMKKQDGQECFEPSGMIAPASDFAFASWALVMPITSFKFAPARLAPLTSVLCISLACRLALVRFAPLRLLNTRVAKVRLALRRSAPLMLAPTK